MTGKTLLTQPLALSRALLLTALAITISGWFPAALATPLSSGSWNHVARIADDGGGMFDGDGQLLSTYAFGTRQVNSTAQSTDFQVAFDTYVGMDILFITGDETVWGLTSYQTLRSVIDAQAGVVTSTNISFESRFGGVEQTTSGAVLSRAGHPEDPWINLVGSHVDGISNQSMVWGENNWASNPAHLFLKENHGGINVFVSVETPIPEPATAFLLIAGFALLTRKLV